MHGRQIAMQQPGPIKLAQNRDDAAGAMHVLEMHVGAGRRDLAQHGHAPRQPVDVGHGEGNLRLIGGGENMQHGVGRAAHGNVERHRVLEGFERRDGARQRGGVVLLIPAAREIDDRMASLDEQPLAVLMRRQRRAIAGQSEAQRLGEAVHGIGREHAGAGAAGRAGRALDRRDIGVGNLVVAGGDHRVDEIERLFLAAEHDLAGLHRTAGDENRGDVEPQRGHQHARGDLVAIGDADDGVGAMGVDHIFDAVGDDFARGQRIEHAVMAHRYAVVDGDGVEFLGDAAGLFDLARDQLAKVLQMHMAGHELREGIGDGDDRLAEVLVLHAGGAPQAARASHVAAMSCRARAIGRHERSLLVGAGPFTRREKREDDLAEGAPPRNIARRRTECEHRRRG